MRPVSLPRAPSFCAALRHAGLNDKHPHSTMHPKAGFLYVVYSCVNYSLISSWRAGIQGQTEAGESCTGGSSIFFFLTFKETLFHSSSRGARLDSTHRGKHRIYYINPQLLL